MADGPDLTLLRQRLREIERRLGNGGAPAAEPVVPADAPSRQADEVALARLEAAVGRIEAAVAAAATKVDLERLRAQLLAQLAEKPSKLRLWALVALLLAAIAADRLIARLP